VSEFDDRIFNEFLVDGYEALDHLDRDLVELERTPGAEEPLARVFRALHTIKGACSFFGYRRLEALAHAGESLLSRIRSGERELDTEAIGAVLGVVDGIRAVLTTIETMREEPPGDDAMVLAAIDRLLEGVPVARRQLQPRRVPAAATERAAPAHGAPRAGAAVHATDGDPTDADEEVAHDDSAHASVQHHHVRVDVTRLDRIMNLVGELVLARNQVVQFVGQRDWGALVAGSQRLDHVTTRLQEEVMRTRMQAISALWLRIPRLVRDVSSACDKRVRLEMEGNDTELDKTLIEAIKDPLLHLVRNAIDHGIEPPHVRIARGKPAEGRLRLRAFHEGGQVNLEVGDDGAGLPIERIRTKAKELQLAPAKAVDAMSDGEVVRFIFVPGFSTASRVTGISGRGVGMDVVKAGLERIGGTVDVQTAPGEGTTFRIRIPLTLAIIPALMVACRGERYAIPRVNLVELLSLDDPAQLEWVQNARVHRLRGELLPVLVLDEQLGVTGGDGGAPPRVLLVLRADGRPFGLAVDAVHDTEEIVVKPIAEALRAAGVYSGATIRGDGHVAMILDVPGLARRSGMVPASGVQAPPAPVAPVDERRRPVMIVGLGPRWRVAIPLGQIERIEDVAASDIGGPERAPAMRWRDGLIPIVRLAERLGAAPGGWVGDGSHRVIVHLAGRRATGYVVETIEDIALAECHDDVEQGGGHAIVGGRILSLVDLEGFDAGARERRAIGRRAA
jgi:two-component system chemotaxis sensor kinase CheA